MSSNGFISKDFSVIHEDFPILKLKPIFDENE